MGRLREVWPAVKVSGGRTPAEVLSVSAPRRPIRRDAMRPRPAALRASERSPPLPSHCPAFSRPGLRSHRVCDRADPGGNDPGRASLHQTCEGSDIRDSLLWQSVRHLLTHPRHHPFLLVGHGFPAKVPIMDRFGQPVRPKKWFLVPLAVIDEAVQRIRNGTITQVVYDPTSAQLITIDASESSENGRRYNPHRPSMRALGHGTAILGEYPRLRIRQ